MADILLNLFPNMEGKLPELWQATLETLTMVGIAGGIAFFLGLFFGVVLIVTREGGVLQNRAIYFVLDKLVNLLRSIPFVIMIAMLYPLTRLLVGTGIGVRGAIVPLVIGTVPFFSRQIESALADVDPGLVEAAESMGTSPLGIIFRVYLRESIPGIVRATSITFISLVGLTAMAGAVGAGGLGDFALRYGHQRRMTDVIYVTVAVILVLVLLVQWLSNRIIRFASHDAASNTTIPFWKFTHHFGRNKL